MRRPALLALALLLWAGCGDDDRSPCEGPACAERDGGPCDGRPALLCTATVTATCTGVGTPVSVPTPAVDETCGALAGTVSSDAPGRFGAGETAVRFEGVAEDGATVSCVTTVTVTDAVAPTIACPEGAVVVRASPAGVAPPGVSASDACDAEPVVTAAPATLGRGTTEVTWTAVDAAGNAARCAAGVQVLDAFAPEGFRIISARLRTDGTTDVTLAWDGSRGADTTGYALERGPSAEGPWTRLATVGAAARTWTDLELGDDRAHYRVVALAGTLDGGATGALEAHSIAASGYDLRGRSVPTVSFPTTLYGVVRHPVDLAAGPYPLALLIHGNHGNCRRTITDSNDTCGDSRDHECPFAGWVTTPNAEGLAYLAETLAAQGLVAVSISANALNCRDDYILARAHLVITHLRRWLTWNTLGGEPYAGEFVGALDLGRIALVGHSRGGEAVAHVPALLRADPVGGLALASVFSIAPTDYHDPQVVDAPYAVLLPGCDGDVSTLEGMHIYDRSVVEGDGRLQSQVLFARANHNYFNTEWRLDDNGDGRVCARSLGVGGPAQRGMLEGVLGSWVRSTVLAAPLEGFVRAEAGVPEGIDAWADAALDLRMSYSAPERLVIADFSEPGAPATNRLGGSNVFSDDFYVARSCFQNACDTRFDHYEDALFLSWDGTGMPAASFGLAGLDASAWATLSFRMVSRRSLFNDGKAVQDFWLGVQDASGGELELLLSDVQRVPHLYPANAPHEILQTVRLSIARLEEAGIDVSALERLRIRVPAPDSDRGSFLLTDLELAN